MASRARFETNKGLLAFSRGILTLRDGEKGVTKTYSTVGEAFAPSELIKWKNKNLSVEVYVGEGTEVLTFEILKNPQEIREEGIKAFAPKERDRLQAIRHGLGLNVSPSTEKELTEATAFLTLFEKRYANYLPQPKPTKKQGKKKSRKAETKTEES